MKNIPNNIIEKKIRTGNRYSKNKWLTIIQKYFDFWLFIV